MYINEQYHDLPLVNTLTHTYIGRDGTIREETEAVLEEHLIDVYINDQLTMKLICLPQYLTELVLGRLFTEGMIRSANEVEQIYVCEFGKRARVILKPESTIIAGESNPLTPDSTVSIEPESQDTQADPFVEKTASCCTGNRILNDYFITQTEIIPIKPIPWKTSWIFDLADRFAEGMPIHSQTWATHSCFLALDGTVLFQCEDIGRHNALDKAIGYALRNQIDLTRCVVYSSGRIPTDMAIKAIRAGIPVLSSKAAPTTEAIELAREYDLTLICAARRDRMKQFSGPAPIE